MSHRHALSRDTARDTAAPLGPRRQQPPVRPEFLSTPGPSCTSWAMATHIDSTAPRRIVLAVTGASGMPYAEALARALAEAPGVEPHMIISSAARTVMAAETDTAPEALAALAHAHYGDHDLAAPPASGSWVHHGMVVCPCSMASLAAIASGLGTTLVHRAADVTLKEARPLVLVPREAPLSTVHLENMLRARRAGAHIVPACPGFYHRPATIQDLVDHLAARVLDLLDVPHGLSRRWGG